MEETVLDRNASTRVPFRVAIITYASGDGTGTGLQLGMPGTELICTYRRGNGHGS